MNGAALLAGYLLVGLGLAITTAPANTGPWARVAMAIGWLVFLAYAAISFAIQRGDDL